MDDVSYNAWLILRALDRATSGRLYEPVNLHTAVAQDGTQNYGEDYTAPCSEVDPLRISDG